MVMVMVVIMRVMVMFEIIESRQQETDRGLLTADNIQQTADNR
jgi:hypothetical protein